MVFPKRSKFATVRANSLREKVEKAQNEDYVLKEAGYLVDRIIAKGEYYVTKFGRSLKDNCDIAVKIVKKTGGAPFAYLQRLLTREWVALKKCQHPNVIRVIDIIEWEETAYLVTEFAPNGSLRKNITNADNGRIHEMRAKIWFSQLLAAVEHCHECGWAHRNINVDDILIDEHRNIRLSGFSNVAPLIKKTNGSFKRSKLFDVHKNYASPEIIMKKPYDSKKYDIYCLGVVLFAMILGGYPFMTEDLPDEEILAQMKRSLVFPDIGYELSPHLERLLSGILNIEARRPSIGAIRRSQYMHSHYQKLKKE